jgi:hypothetical protein
VELYRCPKCGRGFTIPLDGAICAHCRSENAAELPKPDGERQPRPDRASGGAVGARGRLPTLQTEIPERYLYLVGGIACFFLPAGARFLLAAGMRRAMVWVLLDAYAWVPYLFGVFFVGASWVMFARHSGEGRR